MNDKEIKIRIRLVIEALKMKPAAFAKKTGITKQSINDYLNKETQPSLDSINKIISSCQWLNEGWLLTGKGTMVKVGYENLVDEPSVEYGFSKEELISELKICKEKLTTEYQTKKQLLIRISELERKSDNADERKVI